LRRARGKKKDADVAKAAQVGTEIITKIERGLIHCSLGQFRQVVELGYGKVFEDLLAECYAAFESKFGSGRPFAREDFYSVRYEGSGSRPQTPFLVGGEENNYLWAVPVRTLQKRPASIDLLELAPQQKLRQFGETPPSAHEGFEIVHVIFGGVDFDYKGLFQRLKAGDSIYFDSKKEHKVFNSSNTTVALVQIVRMD
jgi:mannose-6-phosphate isomerase-like protein (cupin superfamily)